MNISNNICIKNQKNAALDTQHGTGSWDEAALDERSALALKNVFFFLGLIFRYPGEAVYSEINRHMEAFGDFFSEYGDGLPSIPPVADLQSEYVSLFVNNKGCVPALPYASPHMDNGLLMDATYFRVKRLLQDSGFKLKSSANELEDHLAVLLESCACLVQKLMEKTADEKKNSDLMAALQKITSCIEEWIDDFEDKIHSYATFDFYKASAQSLKNFIHDADSVYEQVLDLRQEN
jgi:TorA maturation chaperone TorD